MYRPRISVTPPSGSSERRTRRAKAAESRAARATRRGQRFAAQTAAPPSVRQPSSSASKQQRVFAPSQPSAPRRESSVDAGGAGEEGSVSAPRRSLLDSVFSTRTKRRLAEEAEARRGQSTSGTPSFDFSTLEPLPEADANDRTARPSDLQRLLATTSERVPQRFSAPTARTTPTADRSRIRQRRVEAGLAGKSMETGGRTAQRRSRGRSAPVRRRRRQGASVSFPSIKAQQLTVRAEELSEQQRANAGVLDRFRRLIQRVIGAEQRTQLETQRRQILRDIERLRLPSPRLSVRSTPQRIQQVEERLQQAQEQVQELSERTQALGDAIASAGANLSPEELRERLPTALPVRRSSPPKSGTPKPRTKKRCPAGLRRGPGNRCYGRSDLREIRALQRYLKACAKAVPIAEKMRERFHANVPMTVIRSVAPPGVSLLPKVVRAPRSRSSVPKSFSARRKAVSSGKSKVRRKLSFSTTSVKPKPRAAPKQRKAKQQVKAKAKAAPKPKKAKAKAAPKRSKVTPKRAPKRAASAPKAKAPKKAAAKKPRMNLRRRRS